MADREENLLRSMTETSTRFYLWVGMLCAVILWGLFAYLQQLRSGLIVTGMRDQISWGLYITNFVFFIGISHAGTLISAILRVTHTDWRRPITRLAEGITVFALCIGAPMVIVDLGRPERLLNMFRHGRIQSPILWDVLSVSTYLAGCFLYLYIPMIPDLGILAKRPGLPAWRTRLYRGLSLGWRGTPEQWHILEKAISIMAVVIIPLAVSVHTVVSWIFSMTLRPGWNSSIFGPYFVVGAIYSGAAAVVFSMYLLRRLLHLEAYLETQHFRNLGLLLLAFAMLYLYFNINEYLTAGYKLEEAEKMLLFRLFYGDYAVLFWSVQFFGVFVPLLILMAVLGMKRYRPLIMPGVALASFLVITGAWAKRYLIVIPTLASPFLPGQRLPSAWLHYRPTSVEWSITAAAFALFLLIYTLFCKVFPIVSVWETRAAEPPETEPEPVPAVPRRRWGWVGTFGLLVVAWWFLFGTCAHAAEPQAPKKAKPAATTLAVEWETLPPSEATANEAEDGEAEPTQMSRAYVSLGRMFGKLYFGPQKADEQKNFSTIAVKAALRDSQGLPVTYQPVAFSLRTSFGTLAYGSRPTNEMGLAQLIIRDHRYGKYPVQIFYDGDDAHQAVRSEVLVDFGPRPAPALPKEGVLIAPYPTAAVGLPFLFFYGTMWVVFAYAFGYLILWRMRIAPHKKEMR